MNSTPRVTFLLPTFNAAATIGATIKSILAQTMPDFELLVVDDGSMDGTARIVGEFGDRRIRFEANSIRLRLPRSLNRGLTLARSDYVARIDADDICLPDRAAIQADYLDAHPDIALVGSHVKTFTDDPDSESGEVFSVPLDSATIFVTLLLRNAMAHPSVMLRKSALAAGDLWYDPSVIGAEDYDLWARCAMAKVGLANLPNVLVRYRVHAGQLTQLNTATDQKAAAAVRRRLIEHLGLRPDPATLAIHEAICSDRFMADAPFISAAAEWLKELADANERRGCFNHPALMRLLTGRYVSLGRFARRHRLNPPDISASPFLEYVHPGGLV